MSCTALLLLLLCVLLMRVAADDNSIGIGEPAAAFAIKSVADEPVTLEQYRDQVLVLLLMSSRCRACRALAHGFLSEFHAEISVPHSPYFEKVKILSVSVQDSMDSLSAYQRKEQFPWTVALDRDSLIMKYRSFSVPTVVVVDRNGILQSRTHGLAAAESTLRKRVEAAMGHVTKGERAPMPRSSAAASSSERVLPVATQTDARDELVDNERVGGERVARRADDDNGDRPQSRTGVLMFAVAAGFFSFASPCCVAMLPGYAVYLIDARCSVARGSLLSLAAAFGIMCVFGVCALTMIGMSRVANETLSIYLPVIGGLLTVAMGVALLFGWQFAAAWRANDFVATALARIASLVTGGRWKRDDQLANSSLLPQHSVMEKDHRKLSVASMWWFGVTFGSSSASCSAPVFIALIGMLFRRSLLDTVLAFLAYSLSVAAMIVVFTMCVCAFRSVLVRHLNVRTENIRRLGGIVLIVMGLKQLLFDQQ